MWGVPDPHTWGTSSSSFLTQTHSRSGHGLFFSSASPAPMSGPDTRPSTRCPSVWTEGLCQRQHDCNPICFPTAVTISFIYRNNNEAIDSYSTNPTKDIRNSYKDLCKNKFLRFSCYDWFFNSKVVLNQDRQKYFFKYNWSHVDKNISL